jgi:IclR family transcriptional regulator, blcABC operon repressor
MTSEITVDDSSPAPAEPKPVPALVRFNAIMDALSTDPRPRGVSELARELSLPRSTVHGLLRTLADLQILMRVNDTDFVVGPHVLAWASAFTSQSSLTKAFTALADGSGVPETINLSILVGSDVMYISCRQGSDPLGVRFREGLRFPAAFTATGKAILSTMTDSEVSEVVQGGIPEGLTAKSVDDVDVLRAELAETRERGYSIDDGQVRDAMICCGAPVFATGSERRAVAGVAMAMLSGQATESDKSTLGESVRAFADELSRRLGANLANLG